MTAQGIDPRMVAGVEMLRRTGLVTFRIGWVDPDKEGDGEDADAVEGGQEQPLPVVWYAVGVWQDGRAETAASLHPVAAVLRLCGQVIDGGLCLHCGRPTAFIEDADPAGPVDLLACTYQWDPELATFRRSCEGEAVK